jgi:hypothetical protein
MLFNFKILSTYLFLTKIVFGQCVVLTYQTDANQFGNVNENNTTSQFDKVIELKENTTQITFTNTKSCGEDFDKFMFYNRTNFNASPGVESNYRLLLVDQITVNVDTLTMRPNGTSDTLYIKVSNGFGSNLNLRKIRIIRKIQVTGLESLSENSLVTVFPNPAKEELSVTYTIATYEGEIYITDINGKELLKMTKDNWCTNGSSFKVNVRDWEEGMYFLHYNGACKKIIVLK